MKLIPAAFVVAVSGFASSSYAEVVGATAAGFSIKHVVEVAAPPERIWKAFSEIGQWWESAHTFSGDAHNLQLDPVIGGCMCERWDGGGAEHLSVVYAQPPQVLGLTGAIGPLQEFGVAGNLTWRIEATSAGSRVTLSYSAGGYADKPLSEWAAAFDQVLGTQVQRLARYAVTGKADAVPAAR